MIIKLILSIALLFSEASELNETSTTSTVSAPAETSTSVTAPVEALEIINGHLLVNGIDHRFLPALDWLVWDSLAGCESTKRWNLDSGRFDGGLQIHLQTWIAYGGLEFAPTPSEATREQQIVIGRRIKDGYYTLDGSFRVRGQTWKAWPTCSRKLRLR